eukprot:TRINITY_DN1161_c0_g1_i2.p1 TRINITY_DN1161_c0_g1~~TRINITY_DN1161_c0_g1_i2.p1  ORF type:complete len:133 (-),score=11.95 TRINITY_DN1161_c0_g1_i2:6-404(-)
MSYDFSRSPGPNAPINWQLSILFELLPPENREKYASKVLLGLPFYGYDWDSQTGRNEAILGNTFVELLKVHEPTLNWDENSHEHSFVYNNKQVVYYPTLKFLESRIKLAETIGCGVGIWEIGQGLDYFYELL